MVSTQTLETDGLSAYKHTVGYDDRAIDDQIVDVVSRLMWKLSRPNRIPIVAFYVGDDDGWQSIQAPGWMTLKEKPERRREGTLKLHWVAGTAAAPETLGVVYRFAWNNNWANEPIVAVIAPAADRGDLLANQEEGPGLYPEEEHHLLYSYETVVTRAHDGLWITILSRSLASDVLLQELGAADTTGSLRFLRNDAKR